MHFPLPQHIEAEMIEKKNAAWPISIGRTQCADVNALWSA
jgi:hypothetical protein